MSSHSYTKLALDGAWMDEAVHFRKLSVIKFSKKLNVFPNKI